MECTYVELSVYELNEIIDALQLMLLRYKEKEIIEHSVQPSKKGKIIHLSNKLATCRSQLFEKIDREQGERRGLNDERLF
jgi:hypothetical protein